MEDIEDLSKMKVADLKKHLRSKGLPITGNKTELVERLQEALKSDDKPTLDSSGGVDDDEFDEEEILGGEDVDIGKITQEEEAAALAGNLRVKEDTLLLPETQPEKKKISLKRSEPSLSSTIDSDVTAEEDATSNTDISTNLNNDKENSLTSIEEPKHKVIKLSAPASESTLESRAKKFGSVTNAGSEEDRKTARAARFGIDASNSSQTSGSKRVPKLSMEVGSTDLEKLRKRAERFGEVTSKSLSKQDEVEKKKQRTDRFANGKSEESDKKSSDTEKEKVVDSDDTKDVRAKRFGVSTENGAKVAITAPASEDDAKQKRAQRFAD